MSEVAKLDLDGPIDREQYTNAVSHMVEFLEGTLTERFDWCDSRLSYFAAVIPEFTTTTWNRPHASHVDFELVPQDADYGKRLKDMRGRILWYAMSGAINLPIANEIFEASGLPMYGKSQNGGIRLQISLPQLNINVARDNVRDAITWARDNMTDLITQALDGKPPQEDTPYVPASAAFSSDRSSVSVLDDEDVNVADTLRPSST